MQTKLLQAAIIAAITVPCFAQDWIGLNCNAATGATSRGAVGINAGEVMTRIDGEELAGWGAQTPGFRTVTSLFYVVQDQNAATPENYDIKLYPEDPLNPGFPQLTAGVVYRAGIAGPTGTGIVALAMTVPPATPGVGDSVPIQGGGDVFVSFAVPAAGWSADGLSFHIVLGYAPSASFTVYDIPGLAQGPTPPPAGAPWNSHGLSFIPPAAISYSGRRNINIDVAHTTSGGRALAITNQTSYVASNNPPPAGWGPAPGTGDMLSGVNPDAVGGNPGRVDDMTMEYYRTGMGTGALVVFLYDLGSFGPEVPVSFFTPGTGMLCLNLLSMQTLGVVINTTLDEAWLVTSFPAPARPLLAGLPVTQQAASLDATGQVHASPCSRQVF